MKKLFGTALLALCMTACGNQTQSETDAADSLANDAPLTETAAQGDAATDEAVAEETQAEEVADVLNLDLMGNWSNNDDPSVSLALSDKVKNQEGHQGYGILSAYNEYYENEFTLIITSIKPEGNSIRASYDKYEMSFEGGDPDDLGAEDYGEWTEEKVGTGSLLLVPSGAGKLKVDSKEGRLRNVTLYKQ